MESHNDDEGNNDVLAPFLAAQDTKNGNQETEIGNGETEIGNDNQISY